MGGNNCKSLDSGVVQQKDNVHWNDYLTIGVSADLDNYLYPATGGGLNMLITYTGSGGTAPDPIKYTQWFQLYVLDDTTECGYYGVGVSDGKWKLGSTADVYGFVSTTDSTSSSNVDYYTYAYISTRDNSSYIAYDATETHFYVTDSIDEAYQFKILKGMLPSDAQAVTRRSAFHLVIVAVLLFAFLLVMYYMLRDQRRK